MIRIEDISFAYRKGRKQVFRHFNAELELGGIYGLLGKNGAGKSTLLHLMAGLVAPSEGKVLLHGEEMSKRSVTPLQSLFLVPEEFFLARRVFGSLCALYGTFLSAFQCRYSEACAGLFRTVGRFASGPLVYRAAQKGVCQLCAGSQYRVAFAG